MSFFNESNTQQALLKWTHMTPQKSVHCKNYKNYSLNWRHAFLDRLKTFKSIVFANSAKMVFCCFLHHILHSFTWTMSRDTGAGHRKKAMGVGSFKTMFLKSRDPKTMIPFASSSTKRSVWHLFVPSMPRWIKCKSILFRWHSNWLLHYSCEVPDWWIEGLMCEKIHFDWACEWPWCTRIRNQTEQARIQNFFVWFDLIVSLKVTPVGVVLARIVTECAQTLHCWFRCSVLNAERSHCHETECNQLLTVCFGNHNVVDEKLQHCDDESVVHTCNCVMMEEFPPLQVISSRVIEENCSRIRGSWIFFEFFVQYHHLTRDRYFELALDDLHPDGYFAIITPTVSSQIA